MRTIDRRSVRRAARHTAAGRLLFFFYRDHDGYMADGDGDDDVAHELAVFLEQDQAQIASEYDRIYQRTAEDPGTAGDEGEENWAKLLRDWLPAHYDVVTKGRVLFPDKTATPQIDVLVLRGYPRRLLDKKLYLSSGVVAAFECKNTLKASHITKAADSAAILKAKSYRRSATLLAELQTAPVFGLLAHSHSWKAASSTPIKNVDEKIAEVLLNIDHPSNLIDLVCVADLTTWTLTHNVMCPWVYPQQAQKLFEQTGHNMNGEVYSGFLRYDDENVGAKPPNPVALLMAQILARLGWYDANVRPLAEYFFLAGIVGAGKAATRTFSLGIFSPEVQQHLRQHGPTNRFAGSFWDPWQQMVGYGLSP